MKSVIALVFAIAASMVSAGVVITPIRANQVVPKNADDCFFGVTTPAGCAYVIPSRSQLDSNAANSYEQSSSVLSAMELMY
jgi:hypothetical protein